MKKAPTTPVDLSYTAEYLYIDSALKSRWDSFQELLSEMDSFRARPYEELSPQVEGMLNHLQSLNPGSTLESLLDMAESLIGAKKTPEQQFKQTFSHRFMSEYVVIIFLVHALCEAVINAILAIGLAQAGSTQLFGLLERADVKQKWCVGPKSFKSEYDLPRGSALYETLGTLIKQRNVFIHYKIGLHLKGQPVLEGSEVRREYINRSWALRFFSLPYDLADFAHRQLNDPHFLILHDRGNIAQACLHKPN